MKTEDATIYKKLYYTLFNAVTDALHQLEELDAVQCRRILIKAQQKCEEIYISGKINAKQYSSRSITLRELFCCIYSKTNKGI